MTSVSEQLIANSSWSAWKKAKDLHKRIFFTLFILIIYRFGSYIPLPGINPEQMRLLAEQHKSGFLGMFNMVSGGALERMSVFALNLMPYISSSIIVQLMTAIFPYFMALKKEGASGRRKLSQYTRYGTIGLAIFQAIALSSALMSQGGAVVYDPGFFFIFSTIVTILGATLFLMWLGEQITARGVGNGSSMIIYGGIMAVLPRAIFHTLELNRTGGVASSEMVFTVLGTVAVIAFIVFMERSFYKVKVQNPRQKMASTGHVYGTEQTYIPLKLNPTGVLPPIFAMALLGFFKILGSWPLLQSVPILKTVFGTLFADGGLISIIIQFILIIFFAFFYTTIVFNTEETADNLRKNGSFIPGYAPGVKTAQYFVYLLNRLTVIGSAYLACIVVLPSFLNYAFGTNFTFQGTSFLISVSVSLELISQVHSHLVSHQYGHLMRKRSKK